MKGKSLLEELTFIPSVAPADIQSAGSDGDSINMGLLDSVVAQIILGAITGNDTTIKAYAGATAGVKTTELAFRYRLSSADFPGAGADQYGAITAVAAGGNGLIFTDSGNFNARLILLEVKAIQMPAGLPWLTIEIDDGSASGLFAAVIFVGVPKYPGNDQPTVL